MQIQINLASWKAAIVATLLCCATVTAQQTEHWISVPDSSVRIHVWEEATSSGALQAFYAVALDGRNFTTKATSYELLVRGSVVDPLRGMPSVPESLQASSAHDVYIVQFLTQPLEVYRRDIRALGGSVYKYLGRHAYIVRLDDQARQEVEQLPYVRWVGPYHPAYKVTPELRAELVGAASSAVTKPFNVMVWQRGPAQKHVVADRIRALGGIVESQPESGFRLTAKLNAGQLRAILAMSEVQFADPWGEPGADMDIVRATSGANYVENVFGFTGQGVRGEVLDTGLLDGHQALQNPPPLFHTPNGASTSHGTATYGIIFGDGTGNPAGRGMLPTPEQGIFATYTLVPDRYIHTEELVDPNGPYRGVFQSSSVGGPRTHQYTSVSAEMDDILFIYDLLVTQANGNSGNPDSRPESWAKNIVTIGGVVHHNTISRADDEWGQGSSTGPALDGRIKPDLIHFYDNILTLSSTCSNCYTALFGGTSASTPIVAGHFGLMFQMWHEQMFPGFGGTASVFESRPHMTTAKALLINSAWQYPLPNEPGGRDIGRYVQGWGLPDLQRLVEVSGGTLVIDETDILRNLESTSYEVLVLPDTPELRATLTWADPMGVPAAVRHRINDLTLRVTSPSDEIYWGNNGLLESRWSTPGGSPDEVDTVENVYIKDPEPGRWTVRVIAAEVVEDGHVETPEVDADYALVVSGAVGGGPGLLYLDVDELTAGQTNTLNVFNARPNNLVYFIYSVRGRGATPVHSLGVFVELRQPALASVQRADGNGVATLNANLGPNLAGKRVWLQAAEQGGKSNVVERVID